jgi:hypothetical protein
MTTILIFYVVVLLILSDPMLMHGCLAIEINLPLPSSATETDTFRCVRVNHVSYVHSKNSALVLRYNGYSARI